jgi:hypothetical protein
LGQVVVNEADVKIVGRFNQVFGARIRVPFKGKVIIFKRRLKAALDEVKVNLIIFYDKYAHSKLQQGFVDLTGELVTKYLILRSC